MLDNPPPAATAADATAQAERGVHTGLWLSAARCLLTYVVAPGLGAAGVALGAAGVALQILGACTAGYGALKLYRARRRWWGLYAVIAVGLLLLAFLAVLGRSRA